MTRHLGKVIAFDGPDGVGKTIQVARAAEALQKQGLTVHTTRASGGTPIGEKLREVSLSDTERPTEVDVYISLAMHTALGYDLESRKAAGETCLVDRSPMAILAYNVFGSKLEDQELGLEAFRRMLELWPIDTLFVFHAPQDVINERRNHRATQDAAAANNYFENKDQAYHEAVRQGYEQAVAFIQDHPELGINLVQIDATPSIDEVHDAIMSHLL